VVRRLQNLCSPSPGGHKDKDAEVKNCDLISQGMILLNYNHNDVVAHSPTLELCLGLRSKFRRGKETRRKYRSLVFNIRLSIITLWLWLWMWNSEIEDLRCLSENPGLCLPRMSCRAIFQMCWSWFDWRIGPFSQNNYLKFWIVDTMIDGRNDNWWNEKTRVRNILSNASMSWLFALVTSNEHHW